MNRRIVAIVLAVLLAVLGTTAVLLYVNNADARAVEGKDAVTVLVAGEPIAAGTAAKDVKDLVRAEKMPTASVPSDALSAIDAKLENLVTSANLAKGQLLTRSMLVKKSLQDDVVLPKGKLAVSVPIEGAEQAGSQLRPGFQVAVFNTFTVAEDKAGFTPSGELLTFGENKNQATRLLLPKVEVISVIADKKKGDKGGGFGKFLVTVAVSQAEAEKLIHALATGVVSLAQVNDTSNVRPGAGIDTPHLFTKKAS